MVKLTGKPILGRYAMIMLKIGPRHFQKYEKISPYVTKSNYCQKGMQKYWLVNMKFPHFYLYTVQTF